MSNERAFVYAQLILKRNLKWGNVPNLCITGIPCRNLLPRHDEHDD